MRSNTTMLMHKLYAGYIHDKNHGLFLERDAKSNASTATKNAEVPTLQCNSISSQIPVLAYPFIGLIQTGTVWKINGEIVF